MIRYGNDVADEAVEVVGLDCLRGAGFHIHASTSQLLDIRRPRGHLFDDATNTSSRKAVTHDHCGPLSFGDVMDVYSIA